MESKKKRLYNRTCCVKHCGFTAPQGFCEIPKSDKYRRIWIEVLELGEVKPGDRVCKRHFLPTDFFPPLRCVTPH